MAPAEQAVRVAVIPRIVPMFRGTAVTEAMAVDRPVEVATVRLVAVARLVAEVLGRRAAVRKNAREQDGLADHVGAPPVEGVAARVTTVVAVPMSPVGLPDTIRGTSCKSLRLSPSRMLLAW